MDGTCIAAHNLGEGAYSTGVFSREINQVERRSSRLAPLRFGMHVFDAHDQMLGTIALAREDHFVMRQQLGMNQLVAVPTVAVAGVVGSFVFLTLTPGEIELFCRTLERREWDGRDWGLLPRLVQPSQLAEEF